MTAETTSARDRLTRARLAFRRWRRSRPFWGGLLLLLSGFLIFYSGNLDLGSLQVHLGLPGFQSYVIPLVLALCGVLTWLTPDQRIFYGIVGLLAAVYSLVGANLGGFVVGFVVGVFGGGLTVAWVPQKHKTTPAADAATGEPDDDVQESAGLDVIDRDDDDTPVAGVGGSPLHDTLPTSTQSPLVPSQARHTDPSEDNAGDDEDAEGKQGARFPRPRHAADESGISGEANRSIARFRWSPRTAVAVVAAVAVASIGLVTLPAPTAASAEACASPELTQLLNDATSGQIPTKPGAKPRSSTTSKNRKTTKTTSGADGFAGFASVPTDDVQLAPVVDLLGKVLGSRDLADPTASAEPSAEPTVTPTPDPTPTAAPSTVPKPTGTPTTRPTGKPTGPATHQPGAPRPVTASPSPSTICTVAKVLKAAKGQPDINSKPSKMTAKLLTMSGLSFDGIVDLPTGSGSMKVLQFSMDSSTSTPFELQPVSSNGDIDITSDKLTVSTNVKFYCTEIKGNLLGAAPIDFTVDSPPPLVVPEVFFTDVTIQLAFVYADTLTADNLNIKVS